MTLDKKVSDLLSAQIPDYVQEFYPLFVIFVTKYFEWLEQPGNPQEIIQNIQLNADIDTTASSLATKFMSIYAPSFPQVSALDRTILVKNFREFYRSKGSEESFRYFFRAFFNDEITVKLPGDQLFAPSGAEWYVEKKLRVQAVTGNPRLLAGVEITGTSSNATAIVEEAINSYGAWDLRLENRSLAGTFNSSETIVGTYYDHVKNTSGQITVVNLEALQTLPGRQRGSASLLSADRVLQDSIYWQKFSYVVRTRINLNRWQDAILEQLHPTGRNIFGEILLDNSTSLAVSSVTQFSQSTVIESEVQLFTSSTSFYLQPGFTWDRIADFRTGTSATTSAGAITFDAGFKYGGENVTFALQGAIDGATVYQESFDFTSITGTINIDVTTGQTSIFRDLVRFSASVTSITGTINAVQQVGGDSITFTGTSTLFNSDVIPSSLQIWNRTVGRRADQSLIYEFYPAVLTIRQLPITGTLTIATQTPTAPDYLIYVSGTNTKFRSDLLVTGLNTSSGILNETEGPVVEDGQPEPLIFLDNWPVTGDITFTSGSTSVVGIGASFASEIDTLSTNNLTVTKPLIGRFTQVTSIPAVAAYYDTVSSRTLSTTLSGNALTYALTTSNYSAISTMLYGTDRSTRYDIPTPFPIQFLNTSTTKLYVHASGFIAAGSSAPSNASSDASFRPFTNVPFVGVFPSQSNNLHEVRHDVQGSAPNRYFTVYYNGDYGRATTGSQVSVGYFDVYGGSPNTSMVIRGAAIGNASTTPTSGTATNGYYRFNLPWSIWLGGSSQTEVYMAHNGLVSFGNWIDAFGNNITAENMRVGGATIPVLEQLHFGEGYSDGNGGYTAPRQINRTYNGVLGTAPNRSYLIRFEGDWHTSVTQAAGNSRFIYEMEFRENNLTSILVHFAHPAQLAYDSNTGQYPILNYGLLSSVFYYHVRNRELNSGAIGPDMQYSSYRFQGTVLYSGTLLNVPLTSGIVLYDSSTPSGGWISARRYSISRTPQKWEMSFPENSASPVLLRTGGISNTGGGDFPNRAAGVSYNGYAYYGLDYGRRFLSGGTLYTNYFQYTPWEWAEGRGSNTMVTVSFTDQFWPASSTTRTQFYKFSSSAALSTVIPATQTTSLLLLRNWNAKNILDGPDDISTSLTVLVAAYGNTTLYTTSNVTQFWTGNGVIHRYPQDGYNATASNPNPNPTLGSSLSHVFAATSRTYSGWQGFTTQYGTSQGILFSYGSSALVHSRFVQTVPTFGRTHRLAVTGFVGNNSTSVSSINYNNLNTVSSGQDLEAWYSKDPNTQPPTAGQTPSTLGWIRAGVLASFSDRAVTSGAFSRNFTVITAEETSIVTWLIWQKSFSTQSSLSSQRLSEYLISFIQVSSMAANASTRANTRLVLGSGAVVRVTTPINKQGTEFTTDSYYVAEEPRLRRVEGDQYLVLRPVDTVTSMPYLSSINSWSTGGTTSYAANNVALNNIELSFIESRQIASIINQTTLTVTAAWSSTSNRVWGSSGGSGISRRAFAINTVLTDTSMTLRNVAGAITNFNPAVTVPVTTTSVADRRFTVVAVNSDTDVQVSGGGIYANITGKSATFAAPKPVTINGQTGYLLQGYADNIVNTSLNTRWASEGLPGIDDRGDAYGTRLDDLTANIYTYTGNFLPNGDAEVVPNSSITVLRIFNNSSILVTGSIISYNFLNLPMVSSFPANSSEITVSGTGTIFVATSVTISSATQTFEQVTEFDFNDRRTGYLVAQNGQFLRVISILNDTTLIVSSLAIRTPIVSSTATSFRRTRGFAPPRALGRPGGATFDKVGGSITNDESLIVQDPRIDYTKVLELYHNSSNLTLGTSTVLLSTSVAVAAGSSILLMVTWTKDLADSADEVLNQLRISVSSAGTFVTRFDDEVQRNHKDIAVAQSQLYRGSVYLNSSNSVSSITGVISGDTVSSITWLWTPYNVKRSGTYSRLSAVVDSSTVTSLSITVETGSTETWQSLATDFLNITVIGTA